MKLSLIVGIIAATCAMSALADKASKVTIMEATAKKVDDAYFDKPAWGILKEDGKKRFQFNFAIIKDIPSNASFVVNVAQSSTPDGNFKTLHSYTVKNFCTNKKDPNYKYLLELKKGSKCWLKGAYEFPNFVLFSFYDVLSDAELKSPWFLVSGKIVSGSQTPFYLELKYKSNN